MNWSHKTFSAKEKQKWLKLAKRHRKADRFIQGKWLKEKCTKTLHRGCFFGCMMQKDEQVLKTAVEKMNLPAWLVYVVEQIFEGLPKKEAVEFPVQLLEAIPESYDLEQVWKDWNYTILMDKDNGQINFCGDNKECINSIKICADLFKVNGEIDEEAARSAVRFAAESARSAAESSALSSALSAAESARSAAESAAESYGLSSALSAAESARSAAESADEKHYQWMRDTLISLLKNHR